MRATSFGSGASGFDEHIKSIEGSVESSEIVDQFHVAINKQWERANLRLQRIVALAAPSTLLAGDIAEGEIAHDYLTQMRLSVIAGAREVIDVFGPSTWLWYLRRSDPYIFSGTKLTTPVNMMRVAENLSGLSKRASLLDQVVTDTPLRFPLGGDIPARIADLLAVAAQINILENHIRRAAKGQKFEIRRHEIPKVIVEPSLEAALDIFDERTVASGASPWHPNVDFEGIALSPSLLLLGAGRNVEGWGEVAGWVGSISAPKFLKFQGQFNQQLWSLRNSAGNIDMTGSAVAMKQPKLAAMIVALSNAVARFVLQMPYGGIAVPSVGYIVIHHEDLLHFLDETLRQEPWLPFKEIWPTLSPKEIIGMLKKHPNPGTASTHGAIIRTCRVGHMIDVFSLTAEAMECVRLDPSAGGEWVNVPAFDFEAQVQQMINETEYRPSEKIAALRGRSISDAAGVITDIDAVFETESTLVLVSCKKIDYSQDFDRGEYRRIMNDQSRITDGLLEWENRLERIRLHPKGANHDLTGFDKIEGILVTPGAVFLSDIDPLQPSPELPSFLRKHMSFAELRKALSDSTRVGG